MIDETKLKAMRAMLLSANQYNADGATQVAKSLLLNVVGELVEHVADTSKAPPLFEHGKN